VTILVVGLTSPTHAQDPLLEETVGLTGAILYHSLSVPGLVIGAVRNGKTAVEALGRAAEGQGALLTATL
jgi:D-alanyl-D-alanine-carboxypeptidase/D-alanyl-D-alanine-endopeptidase